MLKIIKLTKNFKIKLKEYKSIIKPYIYIFIILTVCITALIRADFNYTDDLGRVAEGYRGWNNFSR